MCKNQTTPLREPLNEYRSGSLPGNGGHVRSDDRIRGFGIRSGTRHIGNNFELRLQARSLSRTCSQDGPQVTILIVNYR
jgi:hypothetical protein